MHATVTSDSAAATTCTYCHQCVRYYLASQVRPSQKAQVTLFNREQLHHSHWFSANKHYYTIIHCSFAHHHVHSILTLCPPFNIIIGASRSEPHTTEFYAFRGILYIYYIYIYIYIIYPYDHQAIAHASNVSRKTWSRCSAHYVYTIAKKKKAQPQKLMLRHSYR